MHNIYNPWLIENLFILQGSFANGKLEGPGNLVYLVGDYQAKYQGKFHNGKQNGNGTYYYVDGRIYKGGWDDGIQVNWSSVVELITMFSLDWVW